MSATFAVAPVRRRIRVNSTPALAFEIFTTRMGRWWPPQHTINQSPIKDVVVEPRRGGRWFERGEDGSECQWGTVLVWEPPGRLVLAWQISAQWLYDPGLMTEVEVRFSPDDDGTVIDLEHRLDGYGPAGEKMRRVFESPEAWDDTLRRFAREAG